MSRHDVVDRQVDGSYEVHLPPFRLRLRSGDGRSRFDHLCIDVAVGIVGGGSSLGFLDGRRDFGNNVPFDSDFVGFGEETLLDQILLQRDDRVMSAPILDLFAGAVEPIVIIRGVGVVAIGLGLDQARPESSAAPRRPPS